MGRWVEGSRSRLKPRRTRERIMHKCLGRLGYTVLKNRITREQEKGIKTDLTVTTTVLPAYQDFQKPKVYQLYWHNTNAYFLPRFYGVATFGQPEFNGLTDGQPISVECPQGPLPHQHTALDKLFRIFDNKKELGDGGVLQLPCGYGKTYCAIKTICHLGLCGLIIVPTECLLEQWIEAIHKMTGGKAQVGIIQQDRVETKDKDFVIAMLHSICLKDYPAETFDPFGITVFDECHHIGSETFSKAMMKIRTRFVLGLSATPVRRDGLSPVFHHFLGPLFHSEKRSGANSVTVKKVRFNSTSSHYEVIRMANGTKCTSAMTTNISKFPARNDVIRQIIKEVMAQGRKVLVLSSRKEHLHELKRIIADIKTVNGFPITSGFYYGKSGMNRKEHKRILLESAQCDVVLGIDVIAKEGLDIPDLNTLIFATPAGMDVEQPVGRILRKFHAHLNPVVFDLVDNTGNYTKHSSERDKWYYEEGYTINELLLELDVPASMPEKIRDFVQNKQKPVLPRKSREREEIVFEQCVLDDDQTPVESGKGVESGKQVKVAVKKSVKVKPVEVVKPVEEVKPVEVVKPESRRRQKCYLDNYCPPADIPEEKINFKVCHL